MIGATLTDIGKPKTRRFEKDGRVSFHHHEVVGAKMTKKRMTALKYPNELIKDRRTTPYNIGKTIELQDFDSERDDLGPLYRAVAAFASGRGRLSFRSFFGIRARFTGESRGSFKRSSACGGNAGPASGPELCQLSR